MTISTWVNIPSEITGHDYAVDLPGELLYGTYYSSLSVKGLYIYYNGTGSNYDYGNGKDSGTGRTGPDGPRTRGSR